MRGKTEGRVLLLVLILVAVPMVGAIVSLLGRHWYATGDLALGMLRISDVGGSHTPLLGAWSRWGWAHPGPWLFWALAPFYRLFGETGVLAGVAALNVVWMLAAVFLGFRRGGPRLAVLTGLMAAVLAHASGDLMIDPWNPWAGLFPFVVFLLLVWSVLCDDLVMLPVAVAVGSYSAEAHAGYLPLVGGLLVLAALWCAVPLVRERAREPVRRSPRLRWLAIAFGVGLVVWLPAIIDQVSGGDNLRRLASYSRHPSEPAIGWEAAFGAMGAELRPSGPWVTGDDINDLGFTITSAVWPAILTLAAVVGGGVLAWRRGNRDAARLAIVAVAATTLALFASARVTGIFVPYVMRWWWGVAAVSTLAIGWCVLGELRKPSLRNGVTAVALLGLVATSAMVLRDLPLELPQDQGSRTIEALGPTTAAALDREQRYLVRGIDPTTWWAVRNGLFFDLYARGIDVYADPERDASLMFGNWRVASPNDVDAVVMIVDLPELEAGTWQPPAGSRMVASYDPLTASQHTRIREIEAILRTSLGGDAPPGRLSLDLLSIKLMLDRGVPRTTIQELLDILRLGNGYAVYVTPPPPA